jgi:hypothetical protein
MERGCHGRRGRPAQWERREGRPSVGRLPLGFSLQEKRSDTIDDSDLASNGPQPFSHIHAPKINLWQHFFGILQLHSGMRSTVPLASQGHDDNKSLVPLSVTT